MNTDLTFFTNEPDATLLDRFRKTFAHVQYLDILVGYFSKARGRSTQNFFAPVY